MQTAPFWLEAGSIDMIDAHIRYSDKPFSGVDV